MFQNRRSKIVNCSVTLSRVSGLLLAVVIATASVEASEAVVSEPLPTLAPAPTNSQASPNTAIENPDDVVLVSRSRIIDPGATKPATIEMTATNYGSCTVARMKVKVVFKTGPNVADSTAFEMTLPLNRSIEPKQSVTWRHIVNEVRGHGAKARIKDRWYLQFSVIEAQELLCTAPSAPHLDDIGSGNREPSDVGLKVSSNVGVDV
jgi:hypothetical protein